MVLPFQLDDVYRESILGHIRKKARIDSQIARMQLTLESTICSVLPGFASAGEGLLDASREAQPFVVDQQGGCQ
jgi:hypothetical protein